MSAASGSKVVLRPLATEAMKWLAAMAMVVDHANKYLFEGSAPWMFAVGRVAFPLFVVTLAYNLARSDALARLRTTKRLALFGAISTVPYTLLGSSLLAGGWWPLCVMWTLLLISFIALVAADGTARMRWLCLPAAGIGAGFVEFWWPGVALGVGLWLWFTGRCSQAVSICIVAASFTALCAINGNAWALVSIPIAAIASAIRDLPRVPMLFYVFYPAHLAAMGLLSPFFSEAL